MLRFRVLILATIIYVCDSAKILAVFPIPSISHQVVFRPITQELARRGHEVTVITPDPVFSKDPTLKNLREIDVHDISYKTVLGFYESTSTQKYDVYQQVSIFLQMVTDTFEEQLKTDKVSELLRRKSDYFDLIMVETVCRPAYVFTHIFKAPAIQISSFGANLHQFNIFGVPNHYILYPSVVRQKLNNLTVWDKVFEAYRSYKLYQIYVENEINENKMLRSILGPRVPLVKELTKNFDMLFMNIHPLWDTNRPVPPNVIYLGGLHQNPHTELPKDLKKFLDESKNGVIYISFGTNVNTSLLPAEKVRVMVNVFSKLPYNVLWKWNDDVLPGRTKNIKIEKWFPQSDLLRHTNVKLFITQGGLQSTDEAITAGVPLLGIPMLGDQWYNVEKYIYLNIGKRLDMETITEEKFSNAIENIINDENYRKNIRELRERIHDQPMSPLDKAIWWIEYVIRHKGAKHLRSPAAGISWAEYLELPLILTLLSILLSLLFVIGLILFFVYSQLFSMKSKVKKN